MNKAGSKNKSRKRNGLKHGKKRKNQKSFAPFFIAFVVIISIILATVAVMEFSRPSVEEIDRLSTCSRPTGEVVCKGLDVSSYQKDIDFEKVKSQGFDFVILRAGTGKGKDKKFDTYYKQATNAGLDVGCYFYSYATNPEEAKQEAETTIKYIKNKKFTYPVFYDFEESDLLTYERIQVNTEMINTFCKTIKRGGFYPGVYTSSHIHRDFIDAEVIDAKWDVWIANYGTYSQYIDHSPFSNSFSMWQYTDKGVVDGISTNVDMNLCFVDYPAVVEKFNNEFGGL